MSALDGLVSFVFRDLETQRVKSVDHIAEERASLRSFDPSHSRQYSSHAFADSLNLYALAVRGSTELSNQ